MLELAGDVTGRRILDAGRGSGPEEYRPLTTAPSFLFFVLQTG
jgi:hypothetical protein